MRFFYRTCTYVCVSVNILLFFFGTTFITYNFIENINIYKLLRHRHEILFN